MSRQDHKRVVPRRVGTKGIGKAMECLGGYLDPVKVYLTSSSPRAQQQIVDELIAEIRRKSGM